MFHYRPRTKPVYENTSTYSKAPLFRLSYSLSFSSFWMFASMFSDSEATGSWCESPNDQQLAVDCRVCAPPAKSESVVATIAGVVSGVKQRVVARCWRRRDGTGDAEEFGLFEGAQPCCSRGPTTTTSSPAATSASRITPKSNKNDSSARRFAFFGFPRKAHYRYFVLDIGSSTLCVPRVSRVARRRGALHRLLGLTKAAQSGIRLLATTLMEKLKELKGLLPHRHRRKASLSQFRQWVVALYVCRACQS